NQRLVLGMVGVLRDGGTRQSQRGRGRDQCPCDHHPLLTLAPPSTGSVTPVMKFASSEARKSAALATSQPVPIFLRNGTWASRIASISARVFLNSRARVSTAIGVFIRPGRMTLARTPYCAFW